MNSTKHQASLLVSVIAFVAGDASAQTTNLKADESRDRQGSLYLWHPVVENPFGQKIQTSHFHRADGSHHQPLILHSASVCPICTINERPWTGVE
jgi:hypothetical protein